MLVPALQLVVDKMKKDNWSKFKPSLLPHLHTAEQRWPEVSLKVCQFHSEKCIQRGIRDICCISRFIFYLFFPLNFYNMKFLAETTFPSSGPPIAPLPSAVVYNQDSDVPSPVREEPLVVAEPSRPRPSTVTVIHTGTKWRQVPREVSWETTELWDGMKPSQASWFKVAAQFAHPASSHLFLPNHGRNLRSVDSAPFTMAQHGSALLSFPLSYTPGSTEGRRSKEVVIVAVMFSLDHSYLAEKEAACVGSATLKGAVYRCCHHFGQWGSWDMEAPLYALCKYPAWNCWVWSRVMQVKYKLQAVVNYRNIICTLTFLSFWQLLLICCDILLQRLAG